MTAYTAITISNNDTETVARHSDSTMTGCVSRVIEIIVAAAVAMVAIGVAMVTLETT